MARLVISAADGEQQIELTKDIFVVGRSSSCDAVIPDTQVSDEHCEFRKAGDVWRVIDLESRDGTRVNGTFVNQQQLKDGDVLNLGELRVTFRCATSAAAPARKPTDEVKDWQRSARQMGAQARRQKDAPPPPKPGAPTSARAKAKQPAKSKGRGGAKRGAKGGSTAAMRAGGSAPAAARAGGARKAQAADSGGEDRRERRSRGSTARKGADTATITMILGAVLVAGALAAFMLLDPGHSHNSQVFSRMISAQQRTRWDDVVKYAKDADPAGDRDEYARIQELLEKAEAAIAARGDVGLLKELTKAANDLRVWRQGNWKENAEYVSRIDGFLEKYGHLGAQTLDYYRGERAKYASAGDLASHATTSKGAWRDTQATVKALSGARRYGDALLQISDFWKKWGDKEPGLRSTKNQLEKKTMKDARAWFATKLSLAQQKAGQNDRGGARKVLRNASNLVGITELQDKAAALLDEIYGGSPPPPR